MGRPWNEVILLGTHPAHPVYWFDFTFRYISDGFTFQIYFRWFYFSDDFQILSKWHISISDGFSWFSDGFTHIFGFRWFSDSDDFQMEKDMPEYEVSSYALSSFLTCWVLREDNALLCLFLNMSNWLFFNLVLLPVLLVLEPIY